VQVYFFAVALADALGAGEDSDCANVAAAVARMAAQISELSFFIILILVFVVWVLSLGLSG
jgi:hypothetical protein